MQTAGCSNLPAIEVLGPMLAVAAAAIGKDALLRDQIGTPPINASLAFAFCGDDTRDAEDLIRSLTTPLRAEQEKCMAALEEGAKTVEERIESITKQRESFFAGATVRDPAVEASFNAQITRLKNLLRPALILENAAPGDLSHAAANSGGLLVLHGDHSFARLLKAASKGTRDLDLHARSLRSVTADSEIMRLPHRRPIIKPALSILLRFSLPTAAELTSSDLPAVREFAEQVIFLEAKTVSGRSTPWSPPGALHAWDELVGRLLATRQEGPRHLTLSDAAASALAAFAAEMRSQRVDQQRWFAQGTTLARKIALILHLCGPETHAEISRATLNAAVILARWWLPESVAVIHHAIAGNGDRKLEAAAARMYERIRAFGEPVAERELYRTYESPRAATHAPALHLLLARNHVQRLQNGRLVPVQPPAGVAP